MHHALLRRQGLLLGFLLVLVFTEFVRLLLLVHSRVYRRLKVAPGCRA